MSETGWDQPTGKSMADAPIPPTPVTAPAPVVEEVKPQVRLALNGIVGLFTFPDLGGLSISKQWHEVTAEQLAIIQQTAREYRVDIEVKEA